MKLFSLSLSLSSFSLSCIEFDITKFMKNLSYKKETIISLARYLHVDYIIHFLFDVLFLHTDKVKRQFFDIALSLSTFHSVDKWELYIRHFDWLLTDSR